MNNEAKIVRLSEQYKLALTDFLRVTFPTYSDNYIKYDIEEALKGNQGESSSIIVINNKKQIVGCHLYYHTSAWVNRKVEHVLWGHDTYLNKEYRPSTGLDFVFESTSLPNSFGYGLTPDSRKMHQKLRSSMLIGGLRKYCILKPKGLITKILCQKVYIPTCFPEFIAIGQDHFCLCNSPKQINIPNDGFWNKDTCDVDFIRNETFLNNRFFNNPVHKYYVYTQSGQHCYFVVRPILFKRMKALVIVDFRYDMNQPQIAIKMFQAAESLCNKMSMGALLFTTNDNNIKITYNKMMLCKSYPVDFVANKKFVGAKNPYIPVTAADSDDEFLK